MPDVQEVATKSYSLTLEASVTVPADATEVLAFDGRVVGFRMDDGAIVKPCIVFEWAKSEDENPRDINDNEAIEMGISLEYEHRELIEDPV